MNGLLKSIAKKKLILWVSGLLFSTVGLILSGIVVVLIFFILIFAGADNEENGGGSSGCSVDVEGGDFSKAGKNQFINYTKGGVLDGKFETVVKTAKKHKVPPSLFGAIIGLESDYGRSANAKKTNNVVSLMGNDPLWKISTVEEALDLGAKNLYDLYLSQGLVTPAQIGPKYAPENAPNDPNHMNNGWGVRVAEIQKELQGDGSPVKVSDDESGCDGGENEGASLKSLEKYNGKLPKTKFPSYNTVYERGQCTWWAFTRRKELGVAVPDGWGHAGMWIDSAKKAGYSVGKKPVQGAIGVNPNMGLYKGHLYGHVVIVEKVLDGGKKFHSSESNWHWDKSYHEQDISVTSEWTFIYDKKK